MNDAERSSFCSLVSTEEHALKKFKLFPNPIKRGNMLNFQMKQGYSVKDFEVFDTHGKQYGVFQPNQALNLPAGYYTIKVKLEGMEKQIVEKLIIVE